MRIDCINKLKGYMYYCTMCGEEVNEVIHLKVFLDDDNSEEFHAALCEECIMEMDKRKKEWQESL